MLAPSRNHRVEAKFNVSTDFPHLGLHSAAVSGDIGLVQYALSHGQPVNSVLDGVLPLHAACAGGNDLVVNLLIKHGADVNASRLPRRYSDRSRDYAAPIVGTSGATPLHFAAANGHASVVRTLLLHGAHPNRPDKHGITPEIIARQNGWMECADILANENQIRAHGDNTPDSDQSSRERSHPAIEHLESSLRKKLHFKRSIDHALTALKGSCDMDSRPPCFRSSSSEQDVLPPLDSIPTVFDSSERRPSLPHIYDESPQRTSFPKTSRRPGSAGTGAEATPPRKLNSKLSLLSLFKKSNIDGSSSSITTVSEPPINSPSSSSPVPVPGTASPASNKANLPSPRVFPTQLSSSPRDTSALDLHRRKLESNVVRDPNPFHRSTSSSSTPGEEKDISTEPAYPTSVQVRPGILRMHNRSSSSQGSQSASSTRIIRFDNSTASTATSSLTTTATATARTRSPPGLHDSRLRNLSMGTSAGGATDVDRIPDTIEESPRIPQSPPPIFVNAAELEEEDEEEEYGVPITGSAANTTLTPERAVNVPAPFPFSINVPPPDDAGTASESRLRGDSVGSAGTISTASTTTTTYTQSSSSDAAWPPTPHFSGASPLVSSRSVDVEMGPGLGIDVPRVHRSHSNLGLGLDFSSLSISSRADVEALVQRAQQSVLDMESDLEGSRRRDEAGRTALSARLAMFGESLAIERMMKEKGEKEAFKFSNGMVNGHGNEGSLLSSSRPGNGHGHGGVNGIGAGVADSSSRMRMSRSSSGSGASSEGTSLEESTLTAPRNVRRTPSGDIRRMASGDIRQMASGDMRQTRTAPQDDTRRTRSPTVASRHLPLPPTHSHQQPPLPLPSPRTQKSLESFAYTPPRARTPDPLDADVMAGVPLSRISTAPTHAARMHTRSPPARSPPIHAAARSVNKLSRMGFSTAEGYGYGYGWQPSPASLGTMGSPPQKQRFGGIRTIVRGFQGK